jgi:hypothetical protein
MSSPPWRRSAAISSSSGVWNRAPDGDVEADIGERRGDHLGAAVVAVLAELGDQEARPAALGLGERLDLALRGHDAWQLSFLPILGVRSRGQLACPERDLGFLRQHSLETDEQTLRVIGGVTDRGGANPPVLGQ